MPTSSPLFDVNQLNAEQRETFDAVNNELKTKHESYLQYKNDLQLKTKFDIDEEENEWCYELHRYLQVKQWDVTQTVKSLSDMIDWRIENRVDSILQDQPEIIRMKFEKLIPSAYHGYTKIDQPLFIEKTGIMPIDRFLNECTPEEVVQNHIYWHEYNCWRARERSRQVGKHVGKYAVIYDLNGMGWNIRKVFHLLKQCVDIDNNYYPERQGQTFIINPPIIFPAIWYLVRPWVDSATQEKYFIIRKGPETATTLLEHIDSDQLPSEYGGTCHTCPTSPDCIHIDDKAEEQ